MRVKVAQSIDVMTIDAATRAITLLARWTTRRAQRIAKERTGWEAVGRKRPGNKRLQGRDGEERT
jgi:hypothetical protein